uniref:C2H2-type domain-containing protein n=1 Tax=Dicentrarchus labrax TaxID=13489 RepID=A0A8C4ISE8_DICLA
METLRMLVNERLTIKTEVGVGDCGASGPNGDFDPTGGSEEGASDGRLLADCSDDTDDSGDYWREPAGVWRLEETGAAEGRSSSPSGKAKSSGDQPPPPAFSCKVCGESFHKVGYLITHCTAHLKDCGLCGKHLELTESLKVHLRVHRHSTFRCGVCGQSFTLRGNLRTHMRIHSGERPYACTVCGKSFGRRATLVRHVRSHTGEKPFTCTYCGRGFVEKGNLTVHLRTHTVDKSYTCDICGKRLTRFDGYQKHLRIHTGEKPYCCDECGRRFSDNSNYKRHIRTHTGQKTPQS